MNRMVDNEKNKKFMIIFGITFVIAVAVFIGIFVSINNKFKQSSDLGLLTINTTESIVPNDYNAVSASTSQDKTINQVANQVNNQIENKVVNQIASGTTTNVTTSSSGVSESKPILENTSTSKVQKQSSSVIDEPKVEEKKELSFMAPVVGEIITDYADESLIYSKTLDEWTTHLGIDIKADKTSAVVSSEAGTVKSIKNDPRYGLTVIISHENGYETLYANLQTADFIKEGDVVSKNQTIGTVGESASFEVSDSPHLHFEILKDGENVNPTTLMK